MPRATFDLDILIEANDENVERLLAALMEAGLGTAALITTEKILANEITVFNDRVRIDVQTRTPGLEFEDAWRHRVEMQFNEQPFFVVSLQDLLVSKLAAGRDKDLEDVRMLEANQQEESQSKGTA